MQVLAFAASNSKQSINRVLVEHAVDVLERDVAPTASVSRIDLSRFDMPIYSIDRERASGVPIAAHVFFDEIGAADAVIVSFAEHNGSYTAAFKNVFDWASRIDAQVYQNKPMLLMSASPGQRGGASVLKTAVASAPFFGGDVCGSFSVGPFETCFQGGELVEMGLARQLRDGLERLAARVVAETGVGETAL